MPNVAIVSQPNRDDAMNFSKRIHLSSSLLAAAFLLGGCSSTGSLPPEDHRPIAIATEAFEAEIEVREFDIGRGRNAGRGAGKGFVAGAALPFQACGSDCGDAAVLMILLAPFTAAAGTVVGAMAGVASKPEVDFDRFEDQDRQAVEAQVIPQLAPLLNSDALRGAILRPARYATDRPLVPTQRRVDGDEPYLEHVETGVPTGAFAHALAARIVRINVVNREIGGTRKFGLVLWADVAFVNAEVPVDLYWDKSKRLHHISNYYPLEEWQDEAGLRDIAQDAIDDLGLTIANLLL